MTTQMLAEGVDPSEPEALEAWIADKRNRQRR